ncbi:MAG: dihydroxyacetone kinase subunit L [Firmicutes bacterium]|nr:dihydroxyacetone kinase subunit L [Bacillota bacterium]
MESIDVKKFKEMTLRLAEEIQNNKAYLCELDAAIGDGDHGISMAKGFKEAEKRLRDINEEDLEKISDVYKLVGMALLDKIGGATGPIFSTIFLSAAKVAGDKKEADLKLFADMFTTAVEDVCKRGKSKAGEKTLIDALDPAAKALSKSAQEGLPLEKGLKNAYKEALEGVEDTKEMSPGQGKSRYLKDRAIGHQDAGATSISLMFKAMKEYLV